MAVTRCICADLPFADLLDISREGECDFEELQRRTGCGEGCGTCIPYILLTLETGRVNHPILDEEQCVRILSRYPTIAQSLA